MSDRNVTFFAHDTGSGYAFWWLSDDSDEWRAIKDDLKRTFPHHTGLHYDSDARAWTIPYRSVDRLQRWSDAWFRGGRQEWGAAPRSGRQTHHSAPKHASAAPLDAAYARLTAPVALGAARACHGRVQDAGDATPPRPWR